ncbi:MAG TPA: galactosyltransferase-related protein [Thermotogota bacterium]|nr:galactosyltransferase-related protein [Thermotogota bacterium]
MNDKYSIIIPYRNRKEHLEVLLPALYEKFKNVDYEIIISEQDDNDNFNISAVQNIAVNYATGNIYVFHQVDYVPSEDVSYDIDDQPILPARIGIFLDANLNLRDLNDIPGGYRNWQNEIDSNFYGGVIILRKEHFEIINGFNPLYKGWGNEDEDLRERLKWAGFKPIRNAVGTFYCLYHEDNGNMDNKNKDDVSDFINGRNILQNAHAYKNIGYKNISGDVRIVNTKLENVKWIKSTNYKVNI